jgi:hypothetical protein
VSHVINIQPSDGEVIQRSTLLNIEGIRVTRHRLRETIKRLDPEGK